MTYSRQLGLADVGLHISVFPSEARKLFNPLTASVVLIKKPVN